MCEVFIVSEIFEASTGPQPKIYIIYKMSSENSLRYYSNASYLGSGGAEVTGALRTTLPLGPPMENKFQDPDTKTPINVLSSPWLMKILNFDAPE